MSEEEFYNTLKGFTIYDISYLADNNYVVPSDNFDNTSSYMYYKITKSFILDDIKLYPNCNIRIGPERDNWLFNKPREE